MKAEARCGGRRGGKAGDDVEGRREEGVRREGGCRKW